MQLSNRKYFSKLISNFTFKKIFRRFGEKSLFEDKQPQENVKTENINQNQPKTENISQQNSGIDRSLFVKKQGKEEKMASQKLNKVSSTNIQNKNNDISGKNQLSENKTQNDKPPKNEIDKKTENSSQFVFKASQIEGYVKKLNTVLLQNLDQKTEPLIFSNDNFLENIKQENSLIIKNFEQFEVLILSKSSDIQKSFDQLLADSNWPKSQIINIIDFLLNLKKKELSIEHASKMIDELLFIAISKAISFKLNKFDFKIINTQNWILFQEKHKNLIKLSIPNLIKDFFNLENIDELSILTSILSSNKDLFQKKKFDLFLNPSVNFKECFSNIVKSAIKISNSKHKNSSKIFADLEKICLNICEHSVSSGDLSEIINFTDFLYLELNLFKCRSDKSFNIEISKKLIYRLNSYLNSIQDKNTKNEFLNTLFLLTNGKAHISFYESNLGKNTSNSKKIQKTVEKLASYIDLKEIKYLNFIEDQIISHQNLKTQKNIDEHLIFYLFSLSKKRSTEFYIESTTLFEKKVDNLISSFNSFNFLKSVLIYGLSEDSLENFTNTFSLQIQNLCEYDKYKLDMLLNCLRKNEISAMQTFMDNIFTPVLKKVVLFRVSALCNVAQGSKYSARYRSVLANVIKTSTPEKLLDIIRNSSNTEDDAKEFDFIFGKEAILKYTDYNEYDKFSEEYSRQAVESIKNGVAFDKKSFFEKYPFSADFKEIIAFSTIGAMKGLNINYERSKAPEVKMFHQEVQKFVFDMEKKDIVENKQFEDFSKKKEKMFKNVVHKLGVQKTMKSLTHVWRKTQFMIHKKFADRKFTAFSKLYGPKKRMWLKIDAKEFVTNPDVQREFYQSYRYLDKSQREKFEKFNLAMTLEFNDIVEDLGELFSEFKIEEMQLVVNSFVKVAKFPIQSRVLRIELGKLNEMSSSIKVRESFKIFTGFLSNNHQSIETVQRTRLMLGYQDN